MKGDLMAKKEKETKVVPAIDLPKNKKEKARRAEKAKEAEEAEEK